jgi:hypothetical protein
MASSINASTSAGLVSTADTSGVLQLQAANTTVLNAELGKALALQGATSTTGCGIAFPATQVASSDVNTLDDYEEGTWTPTCNNGSTYTGVYTKIGRIVHLFFESASSGTITAATTQLTGLPFSSSGTLSTSGCGTFANISSTAFFGGTQVSVTTLYFLTASSSTQVRGYHCYYTTT